MTRYVRFAKDPSIPATAPDSHPGVGKGVYDQGRIFVEGGEQWPIQQARLLPAVSPSKIVCVGRNYADHAKELGNAVPAEPIIFLKPPSSLNAHLGRIVYPKLSQLVSFEGELGVVIGKRARRLAPGEGMSCVAGYTIVNDVTARDLQKKDGQWTRGKGFDTFCPVGPWWVPKEQVDFDSLRIQTRVNGEIRQDGSVKDMLFSVDAILCYITAFMTLEPGDLIATGTPPGVGPMEQGDKVEVEIPGLGVLENTVVSEQD
jgi:2-keto-4-pentenoate hydratase/2-oxohepta-3-ene-1,7-dioic acid hydratase in catechol pathway